MNHLDRQTKGEGSEIAGQIVKALLERNVKVFFVTHLYHFAYTCFRSQIGRGRILASGKTAGRLKAVQIGGS